MAFGNADCPESRSTEMTQNTPAVRMISLRMSNHAGHSGYHRCTEQIDDAPLELKASVTPTQRFISHFLIPIVRRSGSAWYHRGSMWCELDAAKAWYRHRNTAFHFIYGENQFRYFPSMTALARRGNVAIATYHTPTWRMEELVKDHEHIRRLDAVVVMANSQRAFFERYAPDVPVYFVPHGIDTDFFTPVPAAATEGRLRLICVGAHLRDYATLEQAARIFLAKGLDLEILVVCNPARIGQLGELPNVRVVTGLSDEALRDAYQSSTALLLPLLDATANNSLLEGMACGLPVISTDLPGIRDYTDPDCARLLPVRGVDAIVETVTDIHEGRLDLGAMGKASRQKALTMSWSSIRSQLYEVYRKTLHRRNSSI